VGERAPQLASVTVVIPCWNAEAWVGEAIASALDQPGAAPDVFVVDDGSTDRTLEVVRSFGDRIRWISGPNCGVSAARNRGVSATSSEWIVFLDADDLLAPGTLSARLDVAASGAADVVVCDWREFADDGDRSGGLGKTFDMGAVADDAELACAIQVWATTSALMYRRAIVERAGGFREDFPVIEDARFLFDVARQGARFARSDHVGAFYRVRPQSLSRADKQRFWRCVLRNAAQIEAIWRADDALSPDRRRAIADIYNGAASALFRAKDRQFADAIGRLRASKLALTARNRLALALSTMFGLGFAADLANRWTDLRRSAAPAGPSRA
jgi:glycosyltransferase involved in cell wall biosynthesis